MPVDAADRLVAPLGWTVRQTIGHIVAAYERFAYYISRAVEGEAVDADALDPDELNAAAVAESCDTPLQALLARIDLSTTSLIALYRGFREATNLTASQEAEVVDVITESAEHMSHHAIDLVDAVPELRTDPMVLNWVLYVDYSGDERRSAAQMTLLKEVRDAILAADGELEEDDGE